MIGLRFEIPNEWNRYLYKMIDNIPTDNTKWYLASEEVYATKSEFLFDKSCYSDKEFRKIINNEDYYTVFANIQAYNKSNSVTKIKNYDDFYNSKCFLAIIIIDNIYVDIYSKDEAILKIIYVNAQKNNFQKIEKLYLPDLKTNFKA